MRNFRTIEFADRSRLFSHNEFTNRSHLFSHNEFTNRSRHSCRNIVFAMRLTFVCPILFPSLSIRVPVLGITWTPPTGVINVLLPPLVTRVGWISATLTGAVWTVVHFVHLLLLSRSPPLRANWIQLSLRFALARSCNSLTRLTNLDVRYAHLFTLSLLLTVPLH